MISDESQRARPVNHSGLLLRFNVALGARSAAAL